VFCEHSEEVEKVCAPSDQVMATTASTCCDAEHSQLVIILALSISAMEYSQPSLPISPVGSELMHLRCTLMRLEAVGDTNSRTIECLKRIVALRLLTLEATYHHGAPRR